MTELMKKQKVMTLMEYTMMNAKTRVGSLYTRTASALRLMDMKTV